MTGNERGFTLVEMLVAMTLSLAITSSALELARPAQAAFQVQVERIDMTQRLRAAAAALSRDITMAGSGLPAGTRAISPYLSPAGETGLTLRFADAAAGTVTQHSYYVAHDPESDVAELRRWNETSRLPVIDQVEGVVFTCLSGAAIVDCDTEAITRIRVALRVRAARTHMRSERSMLRVLPEEVVIDVAPRPSRGSQPWP